jgi:branched-chain amino acid transport system substrate-binding protein
VHCMASSRRCFLKVAGVAGVTALAGCSTETVSQSTETPTSASGSDDSTKTTRATTGDNGSGSIKIGFLPSLSGNYSVLGVPQKKGAILAVEQLNANGGIGGKMVERVIEDTAGDPATARQKAARLVNEENVDILAGCTNSAAGLAVQDYAVKQNIVFANQVGADPVTRSRCNNVTFRYEVRTGQVARAIAPWSVKNLGMKIWFHIADYAFGNAVLDGWREVFDSQNLNVDTINVTKSKLGANDFSSYITSIQSSDADFVVLGLAGGDLIKFNQQATAYNLRESVSMVATVNDFLSARQAGEKSVIGTYTPVRYYEGINNDINRQFVRDFINRFNEIPHNHAESMWTMTRLILASAIEEAGGTKPNVLVPAMENRTFDGPMGSGKIRACDHQARRPVPVSQVSEPKNLDVLQGKGENVPGLQLIKEIPSKESIASCKASGCTF